MSLPKVEESVAPYRSYREYLRELGLQVETKVVQLNVISADKHLAKMLNIAKQDAVFRLERLRLAAHILAPSRLALK
ncbi:UTRA domain-containing protein [Paenibacillus foliorum]|uniref:UTRA domain-containing protein n=1 Tax=Paenibacillus foliorum TaxID=2654974 RepID=UPI0035E4215F